MHLRSGKSMTCVSSSSSQAQPLQATSPLGDLNVTTLVGATMAMPVSTEMGVTAPSNASTFVPMTQPEMGIVIPPFTAGVSLTTNTQSSPLVKPGLMIEIQVCRTFLGNNRMVCKLR